MNQKESTFLLPSLFQAMTLYYSGQPDQIQHFVKVHAFARQIGLIEGLPEETQLILEAAALVHDIGIKPALEKYGCSDGPYQEKEGEEPARRMLEGLGFPKTATERAAYLVAHHHTLDGVDGVDYRILLEADFLVNLHENHCKKEAVVSAYRSVFRTRTGRELCKGMFGLEESLENG